MFRDQSRDLRKKAQQELMTNNAVVARGYINDAAALEQTDELFAQKDEEVKDAKSPTNPIQTAKAPDAATPTREGPSVTYHLRAALTVPSRNDQQLIEVARIDTKPAYYYKAVPVLTSHVYRMADLVNKSEYVLLPGEATMYVGTDFVGRMNLPLVAIGERYTVGFGVDPQLQVDRKLVKKGRTLQGGNQVHTYDYRLTVSSYKTDAVKVQVWDRLPKAQAEAVVVSLVEPTPKLSADPTYVGRERSETCSAGTSPSSRPERREGRVGGLPVQAGVRPRRGHRRFEGAVRCPGSRKSDPLPLLGECGRIEDHRLKWDGP